MFLLLPSTDSVTVWCKLGDHIVQGMLLSSISVCKLVGIGSAHLLMRGVCLAEATFSEVSH